MKKIDNALHTETHVANCSHSTFTVFVHQVIVQNKSMFRLLQNKNYIHGLLNYPDWSKGYDIFSHIKPEYLKQLQNKEAYFVFDASTEGFSPIHDFPFFDILYYNCEKYNVDPAQIIYTSANFKDEDNIVEYCKDNNKHKTINVFSFSSFENVITEQTLATAREDTENKHTDKLFSSLSRVNRFYRATGTFLLCQTKMAKYGLISHDKINPRIIRNTLKHHGVEVDDFELNKWISKLPMIVDRTDFDKNWAIDTPHEHIHDSTIFQIVNETLVDNFKDTSLFYSEKTFRPIGHLQPFLIWGQQGCNKYLTNLGYKTYEDWFDLDFDEETDNIKRYQGLLRSVGRAVKSLRKMNKSQRIDWKFKNKEVLDHNHRIMINSEWSRNKLKGFLINLQKQI